MALKNTRRFFLLLALAGLALLTGLREQPLALAVNGGERKTVYLTYDDGPSRNTSHLLKVLEEEGVPATFFVIGREDGAYPDLYREMLAKGHAIGLHSYSHRYGEIYQSPEGFLDDLERLEKFLVRETGTSPTILRFPGGSLNSLAPSRTVLDQIVCQVAKRGYQYYDWNVVSGDDTATVYPPEVLAQNVLSAVKNKSTVVVLFHDAPLCSTTADATRIVVRALKKKGYSFAVLTPDVEPIHFNHAGD